MGFAFPEALLLLLALPLLLWRLIGGDRQARQVVTAFRSQPPGRWFFAARLVLVTVLLGSLVLLAARPYVQSPNTGDYLIVTDVSRSMNARFTCDEPTFLDRAKRVMRTVLNGVPEGKFGIVAADRFAFPISQMTYDHSYLDQVIDHGLFVGMTYVATGTDIGNALSVVADKKAALPDTFGNVKHIVFLSDGHIEGDYRRSLELPLAKLVEADIQVATVAIGNSGDTPIPTGEGESCTGDLTRVSGEVVAIPTRWDILQYIAEETRGQYFAETEAEPLVQYLREEGLTRFDASATGGEGRRIYLDTMLLGPATVALLGLLLLRANFWSWPGRRRAA